MKTMTTTTTNEAHGSTIPYNDKLQYHQSRDHVLSWPTTLGDPARLPPPTCRLIQLPTLPFKAHKGSSRCRISLYKFLLTVAVPLVCQWETL